MRDLLDHADLARYAGQFVWLELNYDAPENHEFMTRYGAEATPVFFILDSRDGQVAAMQPGAMGPQELTRFLDRGAGGVLAKSRTPEDDALRRGDARRAMRPSEAVEAYREALSKAPAGWPRRALAETSLVEALQDNNELQPCAEAAVAAAGRMSRDEMFARLVVAGLWCLVAADPAPWSDAALHKLEPLAREALALPTTVRDHRDGIYRTLMKLSVARHELTAAQSWGDKWLAELDAIHPSSDDERSALDIARVENIEVYGDAERILPALIASERAMPGNYIASLRLAQAELAAGHHDETIAACNRGLARSPGANGRAWLLRIKSRALMQENRTADAQGALHEALKAAQEIPNKGSREMSVGMINSALKATEGR
jgi:tetratricopeptide (TPR) repeat protein